MLAGTQRRRIVRVAMRWLATPYASPGDPTWMDLRTAPWTFDAATLVCRVAMESLGISRDSLTPAVPWLLDHLVVAPSAQLGDLVVYERAADWSIMFYVGNGSVIGVSSAAGRVIAQRIDDEEPDAFRELRFRQ